MRLGSEPYENQLTGLLCQIVSGSAINARFQPGDNWAFIFKVDELDGQKWQDKQKKEKNSAVTVEVKEGFVFDDPLLRQPSLHHQNQTTEPIRNLRCG
jgi:hypothetical protein